MKRELIPYIVKNYPPPPRHPLSSFSFILIVLLCAGLGLGSCGSAEGGPAGSPSPGSAKDITAFSFAGSPGGIINRTGKTVSAPFPSGTARTGLVPTISVSPGATVSPGSGTARDFTGSVTYTVTAEDGTSVQWTITAEETLTSVSSVTSQLSSASGGAAANDPVSLTVALNLADSGGNGWGDLLSAINTEGKYVDLDLRYCAMTGGGGASLEFDPGTANTGEGKIVSLTLPAGATSVKAGIYGNATFKNFTALTEVNAAAVETVGVDAFQGCTALKTVNLPAAQTISVEAFRDCNTLKTVNLPVATNIGPGAFMECTALETVSLPVVTSIGTNAFAYCASLKTVEFPMVTSIGEEALCITGTTALTVTLGGTAPMLGMYIFDGVPSTKTVTVKVPSGATGYGSSPADTTTPNWGNGFRGGGWNGTALLDSTKVNSNISLTITTY